MLVVGRVIFPIVALFCFCKLHRVRWRSDMRRGDAVCCIVGKGIGIFSQNRNVNGHLGVPLRVYAWYLLCSLRILGDYNP